MIHTKPEEIEAVRNNLTIFDGKLSKTLEQELLKPKLRIEQHPLFFSLANPRIFPLLKCALESINSYHEPGYFSKAVKKLSQTNMNLDQDAVVAEIIVAGYYCTKFKCNTMINVVWERKVTETGKNVDISLVSNGDKPINIEVTGIHDDERIRKHADFRYKIKVAIEQGLADVEEQLYKYIFEILDKEDADYILGEESAEVKFTENDLPGFIDFIREMRKKGPGVYPYYKEGRAVAAVTISRLNKLKEEYAAHMDPWSAWMKDNVRIRGKIRDKAKDQLPKDELNFICIPVLGTIMDEIDLEEAFLGREKWIVDRRTGAQMVGREKDGAVTIIQSEDLSPVYGLIYFTWDYSKRTIIYNPLLRVEDAVKMAIS